MKNYFVTIIIEQARGHCLTLHFTSPPSLAGALPTEVFKTDRTLQLNGVTLVLKYYGPAHTDSDISINFTEADVFHTGDTWWNGHFPFIDYSTGGSLNAMIRAAESNLATVTDKTIIIPVNKYSLPFSIFLFHLRNNVHIVNILNTILKPFRLSKDI